MSNPIGNLGTIPTLSIGGCVFTDLSSNLKVMGASVAQPNYNVLNTPQGVAYQVTTGKTLTLRAMKTTNTDTGTAGRGVLLYGTTSVTNSGSAPSGPVYNFGFNTFFVVGIPSTPTLGNGELSIFFQVPSNDYPHMKSSSASGNDLLVAYGYEA